MFNPACVKLFGYGAGEAIDQNRVRMARRSRRSFPRAKRSLVGVIHDLTAFSMDPLARVVDRGIAVCKIQVA